VIINYPFRFYKIKQEETKKRSLASEVISRIRKFQTDDPSEIISRDLFMLCFYLIGINVKDLFYALETKKGYLEFLRAKTERKYRILIHSEAKTIINRYKGETHLLYFAEKMKHHSSLMKLINGKDFTEKSGKSFLTGLKSLSKKLELEDPLTTYWTRHSWASIARNELGISKDDIALCLGHRDPYRRVTEIYLRDDQEVIDRINNQVIDFICKK
jgi:integrase